MTESANPTRDGSEEATVHDGDTPPVRTADEGVLRRGRTLGRYLIVDLLGAGAMGVVYRAYDPDLDRSLALKLVSIEAGGQSQGHRERDRLLREAQAMARVNHPNVISVFDVGTLDDAVYVAMELVDGQTLREWSVTQRQPAEVLELFRAAGRGLAAAHEQGLIHRDFKPDNVMVDKQGRAKVLDFGLARSVERISEDASVEELRSEERSGPVSLDASMTQAGSIVGTPAYMSPEQHMGKSVSAKSDQFSFCVALFEALTGQRPYQGDTLPALAYAVLQGKLQKPSRVPVSRAQMAAIERGLSVDPEHRHASMKALLTALQGRASNSRNLGLLVGAGGVAVGMSAWLTSSGPEATAKPPQPCQDVDAPMKAAWSEERADAIAAQFARSSVGHAETMWTAARRRLDVYANDWGDARLDACRATRVRAEQSEDLLDRRMLCYDRRLAEFEATLSALDEADDTVVIHALDAALALSPLDTCADAARLIDGPRPPEDEATRAVVAELDESLARVLATYHLGHFELVLDQATAVAKRADATGYAPIQARAHELVGESLSGAGDDTKARVAFDEALAYSLEARDDARAANMAVSQAFVVGSALGDAEEGWRYLRLARALIARLGPGAGADELRASAWANEGALHTAQGKMEEALAAHEHARAFWEADDDAEGLARTLDNTGSVLVTLGRGDEAVELHKRAIELRTEIYGAHHPVTANSIRELGSALSKLDRFDEAEVQLERALEIQRGSRGATSRQVGFLLDDLGRILRQRDDLDGAAARHREAYAVWEKLYDGPNPALVVSRMNIGYTLSAAQKFEEAYAEFDAALDLAMEASGAEHPHVVYASNGAASALIDLGRYDDAWPYAKRSIDLEGKVQVDPTLFAESRFIGAHALFRGGKAPAATKDRARALARRARELYAAGPPQWAPYIEKIDVWLAANG